MCYKYKEERLYEHCLQASELRKLPSEAQMEICNMGKIETEI